MTDIDRRVFLTSFALLAATPRLLAQPGSGSTLRLRAINHVSLTVSDLQRSIDFYQGLFGLPLQSRQGSATAALRVGTGPQHLGLSTNPSSGVRTPRIDHFCLGLEAFDLKSVLTHLANHGVSRSEQRAAMHVAVRMRGADVGGSPSGTPEVYLGDPDGVMVQLQDATYCAGSGPAGSVCGAPVPSAKKGLISTVAYSHCTVHVADPKRSNAFYQRIFGMGIRAYQGPSTPMLAVGPGVEFLAMSGGPSNSAQSRPGSINHFCWTVERFDPALVIKTLESFGIKPREDQPGPVAPMRHYITMRREDRGGAKEGTPELYFTDPDGILVQLQDVRYCGGAGALGEICAPK